jgi:phage FluMu protein Com
MDRTTRCKKCGKRLVPVITICGYTDLQCISCDDPAVKLAHSPPTSPEKPTELERTQTTSPGGEFRHTDETSPSEKR